MEAPQSPNNYEMLASIITAKQMKITMVIPMNLRKGFYNLMDFLDRDVTDLKVDGISVQLKDFNQSSDFMKLLKKISHFKGVSMSCHC